MPDPIQVENSFREVMQGFESTPSIRHQYHLFENFVENLDGSFKKYESYIVQITDLLPEFEGPLTWTGIDPEQIELYMDMLDLLDSKLQLSKKCINFEVVRSRLTEVCILLFACLHDVKGVHSYLEKLLGFSVIKDTEHSSFENLDLFKEWIIQKLQDHKEFPKVKRDHLKTLLDWIKEIERKEEWKVFIPVVEKYNQDKGYGRLRKISVVQYSEAEKEDELVWNTHIYGADSPSLSGKKDIVTAARNLFNSEIIDRKSKYYRGGINFNFQNAFHVGNSANLAISALWYTHLLNVSNQRERYHIRSESVITGDIDEEGNVLPVDEETINLKTEAAFFSWCTILVVPAAQRVLFERKLADLRKKYPKRHLMLSGVNHLREVFFDRRLANHIVESRLKYYSKKVKSQEYRVITVPIIMVLLGVIIWLIFGPVDQNPVSVEYQGENMMLKNRFGQTIQNLVVGNAFVDAIERSQNPIIPNKSILFDMNGDGENELIYSRMSDTANLNEPEELIAYSVTGDSIIWQKNLSFDLQFPNKPDIEESAYLVYSLNILKNVKDSSKIEIIANLGHGKFFPSLILKLNAKNGEETGRYVHSGRIKQTETADIDDDGEDEIIGLGHNNAFDQIAVFFALEPDSIQGHSPLTEEYRVIGFQPAGHTHYVQIPQTMIGRVFKRRVANSSPELFYVNTNDELFRVRINDFILHGESPFQVNQAPLIYYFNYNFSVRSIGTQSYYDLWAKNLHEDGMIPFEPDHEYFEAFRDSLLYWDGKEFRIQNI